MKQPSFNCSFLLVFFLALAFSCGTGRGKKENQHPNIIFVLVDDLGWRDVGYMGSNYYETPNIDELAGLSMVFNNAYAACAVCSPTRASIMTGRYPARLGLTDWIHFLDQEARKSAATGTHRKECIGGMDRKVLCPPNPYWMDLEETTIAEVLNANGYVTAHIGKWHLGPEKWFPENQGFDFNYGGADMGQPPSYFDPYHRDNERPGIPTLEPRKKGEYLTDREADEAVRFIREHKDTSFFLNLWHYAVHTPIQAKQEITEKYETKNPDGDQKNPKYAAMIESVDDAMGRIIQTLEENDLIDKTIIIFFSDNGGLIPVTSNKPLRIGKGFPYEGGIREPMFVYWPGITEPETICEIPITSVDFFPTICQMAGIEVPPGLEIDGKDLSPLLKGHDAFEREVIYWHFPHYRGNIAPYSIIRKNNYKLIKRYEGREFELFDLDDDLSETYDLADSLPEKVNELNNLIEQWLQETNAKVPIPNPDYIEPGQINHLGVNQKITLVNQPGERYNDGGPETLLDGWRGNGNYNRGWLGFEGENFTAIVDLDEINTYTKVTIGFLRNQNAWIFLPVKVDIEVSTDGENFVMVEEKTFGIPTKSSENLVKDVVFSFYPKDYRYLRIQAENISYCPDWHQGAGGKAWLFIDEIIIE